MGIFDPVFKKVIQRAPLRFRERAPVWGLAIELVVESRKPDNPDIFRALTVSLIALRAAHQNPDGWTRDAIDYATGTANRACRFLSPSDQELAEATVASLVSEFGDDLISN